MQTDYERYIKMSSLAQIGWWEADFAAGHYLCSDFLCELLGLEGDTISFQDFQKLIREDYREQIIQEFRANANIHRNFYEQTFPIRSRYGEIWLHTRLAHREKVREPMAVINPSVSFNGWKPLRSQNKETL